MTVPNINSSKHSNSGLQAPDSTHYSAKYLLDGRIFSFAHQIDSVLRFEPAKVLEVGVGSGVVAAALKAAGVDVTTLDVEPTVRPDLLGSVTAIPAPDCSFDVAVCCQVLEHLQFEEFERALRELKRVSRRGAILSLPDASPHRYISMRLSPLARINWSSTWRLRPATEMPSSRLVSAGHHWEIGYKGFPLSRIENAIRRSGWSISRTWRVPEKHWHRFFSLRPNASVPKEA